jgi:hypothetical protein
MTKFLTISFGVLFLFSCGNPGTGSHPVNDATNLAQKRANVIPSRFTASIVGFLSSSYKIELQEDGKLIYWQNPEAFALLAPATEQETLEISEERWARFREALDGARVWTWDQEYIDPNVLDGTTWRLEVVYPDRALNSHGSKATPKGKQFRKFLSAVEELIGGRQFR